jgi:hypothetical protein
MADYSMTDEKWNQHVMVIEADLESDLRTNLDAGVKNAIETFLLLGTNDADSRQKWWQNIRNIYSTLEESPIGTGPRKVYPADVVKNMDKMFAIYADGFAALFATHPLFGETERKRGKGGGVAYTDATEYSEARASNFENRMYGYYKNHVEENTLLMSWDGTLDDNNLPNLVEAVIPEAEETSEVDG